MVPEQATGNEQAQVSTQESQPKIQRRKMQMALWRKTATAGQTGCEQYSESIGYAVGERGS